MSIRGHSRELKPQELLHYDLVSAVSQMVVGTRSVKKLGEELTELVRSSLQVDACIIRIIENEELRLIGFSGPEGSILAEKIACDSGIALRLTQNKEPIIIENAEADPTTAELHDRAKDKQGHFVFRSYAGVPLVLENELVGVIGIYICESDRKFSQRDVNNLSVIANQLAVVVLNQRLYQELELANENLKRQVADREEAESRLQHIQLFDPLTGSPGRVLFFQYLNQALSRSNDSAHDSLQFSLACIDIDRLIAVNEALGEEAGDQVIVAIADRLLEKIGNTDILGRLSGDEFVLLLEHDRSKMDLEKFMERIISVSDEPHQLGGQEVYISVSAGVVGDISSLETPEAVMRVAKDSLQDAKANGGKQYRIFDFKKRDGKVRRLSLELDLRKGFLEEQFTVHYQPLVEPEHLSLVGAEALLRWNHERRGLVYPDDFIPAAERSGIIKEIGYWVLRECARQLVEWKDISNTPSFITVNISSLQLVDPNFADLYFRVLSDYSLGPDAIHLEVTESMLMRHPGRCIQNLETLSDEGVSIWIDDFGTGYSSLEQVHRLPLSYLKVDRSFIRRTHDAMSKRLVQSIIHLAKDFDLKVVAEGIETEQQHEFALGNNFDYLQGFYYGKPIGGEQYPLAEDSRA